MTATEPESYATTSAEIDERDSSRSILERAELTGWDAATLLLLVGLLVVYLPLFYFDGWTSRVTMLLLVTPLGLVLMARRCAASDMVSGVLTAAIAWSVITALVSGSPRSALIGFAGRDLSVLTVLGAASCFELARTASRRGRALAPHILVVGCGAGALVGIAQVVVGVETGSLALLSGRPTGLVTNPVYFGALSAMGAITAAALLGTTNRWWITPALIVSGMATTLSGSRVAFFAALVVGGAILIQRRTRQSVVAVGLVAASLVAGVFLDRWQGAGRNAADRLTDAGASGNGRTAAWRFGLEAFADRPLFGYGWGHYRPAVQERFTIDFVRDSAPDEVTQPWFDPHNVGVNLLVSVGAVGALLFCAFVVLWARRAHGPLMWGLAVLAVHWLLQPLSLFTVPIAFLLFAAAGQRDSNDRSLPGPRLVVGALTVGSIMALGLALSDLRFGAAVEALDGDRAAGASEWFFDDPIVADVVARVYSVNDQRADALEWRVRATTYQSDRPLWWSTRAEAEFDAGLYEDANDSIERALALQRFNQRSQRVEILLALHQRDEQRLSAALELACRLGQSNCGMVASELIEDLDDFEGAEQNS